MAKSEDGKIGVGIIGTGFIGPVHVEALKRVGAGVEVTAVCGSESARQMAEDWGVPEVYTDYAYRAMIASPNVDVVHITSPNRFHNSLGILSTRDFRTIAALLTMTSNPP